MRLLLSLYACEPNRGSEPGVGWAWALGMARRHKTFVLTRANNRAVIEAELEKLGVPAENRPEFIWVDLPGWVMRLKKRGIVPTSLYYVLWQFAARRAFDRSGIKVDVIHHVTFCSYVIPGVWWRRKEKVVLGPLGGFAVTAPEFLSVYRPLERISERLRGLRRFFGSKAFFFRRARANADALLFTEPGNALRYGGPKAVRESIMDVAMPAALESERPDAPVKRENRFVWAGTLTGWKACELAIRAYAVAFGSPQSGTKRPKLAIYGKGPQSGHLKKLIEKLNVADDVLLSGACSQERLWHEIRASRGFVFTSVRDTCGSVNIEAMACGTPIVCFAHQGVGEITDDSCAVRVKPSGNLEADIRAFADGMRRLAEDDALVDRMGEAARKRALEKFTWKAKFDRVDEIYGEVLRG